MPGKVSWQMRFFREGRKPLKVAFGLSEWSSNYVLASGGDRHSGKDVPGEDHRGAGGDQGKEQRRFRYVHERNAGGLVLSEENRRKGRGRQRHWHRGVRFELGSHPGGCEGLVPVRVQR